jgi:response regulator RpfG family c-di-GMP phosphodiesterase
MRPGGLFPLIVAALFAVATNRVVNEAIFSVYRAQRFRRSFLPEWMHSIIDQWFSQILADPMAVVLTAVAARIDALLSGLALTAMSVIALPIPRQELAYYHRAQQMREEIVEAMVRALEGMDPAARAHGDRVSALAVETGRQLGMSERALVALRLASRLHDVGLLAGGGGSENNDDHAVVGARVLGRFPDPLIAEFVRAHRDRWDGKGNPDHLRGKAIPLGARILAVAEAYDDALAGRSSLDAPLSPHTAASHIISMAGSVFDPTVVMALLHVAAEQGTLVRAAG